MKTIPSSQPKLSVALAVYNTQESHLRECIESILSQSFTDFECIIYNDASTLSHVEKCILSYNDPRIYYYKNEINRGISATRNAILRIANGEYIAIADHDDISLPQRFEKQVALLDSKPEIGVVSSLVQTFPKKTIWKNYEMDDDIKALLFDSCSILHPASMIRASLLIENNIYYEEDFSPAEDYMLWCRCMEYTQFYTIQEVLLLYRIHKKNTSTMQFEKMKFATQRIQSIMKMKYSNLYTLALLKQEKEKYRTKYIRFLGCIPFLKRSRKGKYIYWYLFHYILILRYRV